MRTTLWALVLLTAGGACGGSQPAGAAGPADAAASDAGARDTPASPDFIAAPALDSDRALDSSVGEAADSAPDAPGAASPAPDAGGDFVCRPTPAASCDASPPDPGARRPFRNAGSALIAAGTARHRGRDLFVNPGERQWLIAKLAYGPLDTDLVGEDVDVYLLRGCGATWEKLGTARTTDDDQDPPREGVDDSGGRVYFEVPPSQALAPGRHRVRFVVAGDLSATELFIEVVPPRTPTFVTDVDGTLTTSETEEFGALLQDELPAVNAGAAAALTRLADKGYRPFYLTARPEWLTERTRELLSARGFPPGVIHTTLTLTGATGDAAARFKTAELAALAAKGLRPAYGFGNTASDAEAYAAAIERSDRRVFYRFDDGVHGGRRVESYTDLLGELSTLGDVCP